MGGTAWRLLSLFYDIVIPIVHVSLILDSVTLFLCMIKHKKYM